MRCIMHGQNSPRVPGMEYVEIEPFTWEDAISGTTSYSTVTRNVSIKSISRPSDSHYDPMPLAVVVTGAWQNDASVVKAIVSGTSRVTSGSCSANLYLIITPDSSRAVNAKIRVEGFIIWGLGGFRCYSQSSSTLDLTMGREVTMQYKSDL